MEVYVVLESNKFSEFNYCGVYSTREKAEERIKEILDNFPVKDEDSLYIQEEEI